MNLKPRTWPVFWPEHLRNTRAMYAMAVLFLGVFATSLAVLQSPGGAGHGVRLLFVVVLTTLLMSFWLGMSLERLVMWGVLMAVVYLCGISLYEGGIFSSTLAWLPLLPLCVFYILPKPWGRWRWVALVVVAPVLMAWLTWRGAGQWGLPNSADLPWMSLTDYVLATLALFMVPNFYQREFDARLSELRQRQQELIVGQQQLEQTQQHRERFVAGVSHELRTPMNAILGLNALLLEQVQDLPQARRVLEHTRQSADHLMTVINDVLDYSQMSSGTLQARPEATDLAATVRAAFELFRPQVQRGGLVYRCEVAADVPAWVYTDRHRLMQILVNLLGNAVKFTAQGQVVLRVHVCAGGVGFEVSDTGIGMTPEQQTGVFERFRQADASIQAQYGGTGLGLTISDRLVQMLGGRLQVNSEQGRGTRFSFVLPLQPVDPPSRHVPGGPAAVPRWTHPPRVLVVDDHPVNRLLVRRALQLRWPGTQVLESENGAQALQVLDQEPPFDLVLMDMVMPVCDGIEAVRQMRASPNARLARTPVLGLTANVSPQDLARFERAGLQGLLLKPFDLAQLYGEVERLVSRSAPA